MYKLKERIENLCELLKPMVPCECLGVEKPHTAPSWEMANYCAFNPKHYDLKVLLELCKECITSFGDYCGCEQSYPEWGGDEDRLLKVLTFYRNAIKMLRGEHIVWPYNSQYYTEQPDDPHKDQHFPHHRWQNRKTRGEMTEQ